MYLELEPVAYGPRHSFASIVFAGRRFVCPHHRHPEFELVAIDGGGGRMVAGDHAGTFRAGDMFLLGEDLPHIFQNRPLSGRGARGARSQVIQFRRDFAGPGLFDLPEMQRVQRLLRAARRGLRITGACRARVRERMREVHHAQGAARVLGLLGLLDELAAARTLRPLAGPGYDPAAVPADGRMPQIMAHIQENFTGALSVGVVARRAGLTPNAFCRYFKRQTRRTFTDVVNEVRVNEACRLLRETTAAVTEVCFASGFGNLAHFHAEFRRRTKRSPLQYRKLGGGL
jgi:AraC-like DNA-binding protein